LPEAVDGHTPGARVVIGCAVLGHACVVGAASAGDPASVATRPATAPAAAVEGCGAFAHAAVAGAPAAEATGGLGACAVGRGAASGQARGPCGAAAAERKVVGSVSVEAGPRTTVAGGCVAAAADGAGLERAGDAGAPARGALAEHAATAVEVGEGRGPPAAPGDQQGRALRVDHEAAAAAAAGPAVRVEPPTRLPYDDLQLPTGLELELAGDERAPPSGV